MQGTHPQKDASLAEFYLSVRKHTEAICAPLETEDYIPQPVVDVSPPKWHIAHTTWFFEEMILKKFAANYREFDANYGFLFNSYYNSIGERTARQNRGDLSRPTVREVYQYRSHVDEQMLEFIRQGLTDEIKDLIVLGLNHEQQHQELLITDLKYIFGCNPLFPIYRENFFPEENAGTETSEKGEFVNVSEGIYEIGFDDDKNFSLDNERARHKVYLDNFAIRKNLVTNSEFLDFIADGGYQNFNLWHSDGWEWVNQNKIQAPLYWHKIDGEWFQFTLGGLRRISPDSPVCHVSFYEAFAFAEWKGLRLPTEFEWETANEHFGWGLRWEWTGSAYLPYPNFKKPAGAVGEYNSKFMINQIVLRGASIATPANHSRPTYRNFFQPHLRWQFTGIRLAK